MCYCGIAAFTILADGFGFDDLFENSGFQIALGIGLMTIIFLSNALIIRFRGIRKKTNIKKYRQLKDLTQQQLVDLVNVRRETIVFLEK